MSGIYLHVPFCKQACSYCDFYFITRSQLIPNYVDSLVKQIENLSGQPIANTNFTTLYIGGGTPSRLSLEDWERIFKALQTSFKLDTLTESTMEVNPDDVTSEYLSGLYDLGIDRLSMGVQSFDQDLLDFMHRAHNADEAHRALELISKSPFDNFTVDLIYGNPGESDETLESDIRALLSYQPPHVSAYALTIEPKTRLGKLFEKGRLELPEDDRVVRQASIVQKELEEAGIMRYEVSNYAQKEFEAVHNGSYWRHENYLGIGPGAHSFWWNENKESARRWVNKADVKSFIESPGLKTDEEHLGLNSLAEEYIMMRLRTVSGLDLNILKQNYGYHFRQEQFRYIKRAEENGMVELKDDLLRATRRGFDVADRLTLDLITT